ncbi:hypothetical protein QFC22_002428 [Naganishia vaughanmartiniae]|uniref:Uncharacterized protein n=1 Tax=Naganishia vaughanmartiniae TaxID=1424756 RepID=A0ACC2XDZ2_9TREE|nr:hypothetical protein QFC22_002428 [Naganishia vaughanmartiniae]
MASTILLALKFLQWWYSPASPRLSAIKGAEERSKVIVKPPMMIPPSQMGRSAVNLEREKEEDDGQIEKTRANEDDDSDSDSDNEDSGDSDSSIPGAIGDATPGTPPSDLPDTNFQYRPQTYGSCVICSNEWANPTITPTGYMGCYLCLYGTVEKHGTCPVTGVPMRVDELRKVLV